MSEWVSLYKGGSGEIEEKKSRFIANIAPVSSVEEANDFINAVKKKYWDAKHNCSAFVIGDCGENVRSSDDGEPSGTAGRPMLEVLTGQKITNVCVVVTRYFGGTLLGTGGLVRAYQKAVKEGLQNCSILKCEKGIIWAVKCEYNDFEKIRYNCSEKGFYILDTDYSDKVLLKILTIQEAAKEFTDMINTVTQGRSMLQNDSQVVYAIVDGKPMIM